MSGLPCGTFSRTYQFDKAVVKTKAQWLLLTAALVVLFTLPLYAHIYIVHVLNLTMVYIIAALGLNLLTGYAGQISIGHAAFMAVGSYTSALLVSSFGFSFWLALPCAVLMTGLVGLVFGLPSLRLKGFYLVLSTLAAQFIIVYTLSHMRITGGIFGIEAPAPRLGSIVFKGDQAFYYLIALALVVTTFFAKNLTRCAVGRAFIAIRDNDLAAEVMGISLLKYKLLAFFIGCCYAGVAGALWAHWLGRVVPEQFSLNLSIWLLGYIIIGGMGTTIGPFLGTLLIVAVTEILTHGVTILGTARPDLLTLITPLNSLAFGIMLALFLIFEPRGLAHRWSIVKSWYRLFPFTY